MDEHTKNLRHQAYKLGQDDATAQLAALDDLAGARTLVAVADDAAADAEENAALWLAYYHGRKAAREQNETPGN